MDLIIIGAGPAGLTAGIYAKTFGIDSLILNNPDQPSQIEWASKIDNYPGFRGSGSELLIKMKEHAARLGVKISEEKVIKIDGKKVITEVNSYDSKAILIATGAKHRKANIPGEAEFLGRGVSYCAVCDGSFFAGKDVVVIGGSAHTQATVKHLEGLKCKVVVLDKIKEIRGGKLVESVIKDDGKELKTSAVFIAIGEIPTVELFKSIGVKVDKSNFIIVDENMKTSVDGIYAAGDITNGLMKQVVTACSDGAKAVFAINKFLRS